MSQTGWVAVSDGREMGQQSAVSVMRSVSVASATSVWGGSGRAAVFPRYGEPAGTAARAAVVAWAAEPRAPLAPLAEATAAARQSAAEGSQLAAWFWGACLAVIVWSLSYLLRQPGVAISPLGEPFSPFGNFALEGMLLALGWLSILVAACLAVLTGVAQVRDPFAE